MLQTPRFGCVFCVLIENICSCLFVCCCALHLFCGVGGRARGELLGVWALVAVFYVISVLYVCFECVFDVCDVCDVCETSSVHRWSNG
jgi:hypothetical protein